MVRQELKKLVVYTFFLAILLIPMLGFKKTSFEPGRAFKTLGVFVAILVFSFIVKVIRSRRKPADVHKAPLTERIGEQINRFPKIYTIGGLIDLGSWIPVLWGMAAGTVCVRSFSQVISGRMRTGLPGQPLFRMQVRRAGGVGGRRLGGR